MEVFFVLVIMGVIGAAIMDGKGRSGAGGFFLGLLLGPLGLILAFVLKGDPNHQTSEAVQRGEMRRCPYCAEAIRYEAIRCRYCGSDLNEPSHALPSS